MRFGPDATRYILAGRGVPVAKPFHLRVLAPLICRDKPRRWFVLWLACWPTLAALETLWARERGLSWAAALVAAVLLLGLPGVWGPEVVRPVGVDLPAMVLGLGAVVAVHEKLWPVAVICALLAGLTKESAPVWAALWAWSWVPLLGLAAPLVISLFTREEIDECTALPNLREVHDHPVRTALKAHAGQWRDAWVMVIPFGACLIGLYHPSISLLAVLALGFAQLVVATDTVRLLHTAVGPAIALAAASNLPGRWLIVAAVAHIFWLRKPQLI